MHNVVKIVSLCLVVLFAGLVVVRFELTSFEVTNIETVMDWSGLWNSTVVAIIEYDNTTIAWRDGWNSTVEDFVGVKQFYVPYNSKIADICESDTDKHFLDLESALSETRKIIAVILGALNVNGTGGFGVFPNEGEFGFVMVQSVFGTLIETYVVCVIKDGSQRVQYAVGTVYDDFDVFCFGYVVEE